MLRCDTWRQKRKSSHAHWGCLATCRFTPCDFSNHSLFFTVWRSHSVATRESLITNHKISQDEIKSEVSPDHPTPNPDDWGIVQLERIFSPTSGIGLKLWIYSTKASDVKPGWLWFYCNESTLNQIHCGKWIRFAVGSESDSLFWVWADICSWDCEKKKTKSGCDIKTV